MTISLSNQLFTFFPDLPSGTGNNAGVDKFTTTSLTQLSNGDVVLGYNGLLAGVAEIFDPADGSETVTNAVFSDTFSAFGSVNFQDTEFVSVAALSNGGFVAAWQQDVGFSGIIEAHYQTFDANGSPVSAEIVINNGSGQHPGETNVYPTSAGFALEMETPNGTRVLEFFDNAAQSLGPTFQTNAREPIQVVSLSNGNVAVLFEIEGGTHDDAFFQIMDPSDGSIVAGPTELTVVDGGVPALGVDIMGISAAPNGGFGIVYSATLAAGTEVFVELYNNDGSTHRSVPSPRQIDLGVPLTEVGEVAIQTLDSLSDGYMIAFQKTDVGSTNQNLPDLDIFGLMYDGNEALIDGPKLLVSDTDGMQTGFDLLHLGGTQVLLSYVHDDVPLGSVRVQVLDVTSEAPQPTDGNDALQGDDGDNIVDLLAGDDFFFADDGDDSVLGNTGDDTLQGGPDNDTLNGGPGADELDGGDGIDTADYGDALGRVLVDLQNDVRGAGFARFFDEGAAAGDTFISIENVIGSDFADNLRGDANDNVLEGGAVSDRLYGRAGDDTLDGGTGVDALYGNLGADVMTGGPDLRGDRFIYFSMNETGVGAGNRDIITDFQTGLDRIEIRRFDADTTQGGRQGFDFVADAAFTNTAGELRYEQTGGNTIVQGDVNGDGLADFEIELTGIINLVEGDFFI